MSNIRVGQVQEQVVWKVVGQFLWEVEQLDHKLYKNVDFEALNCHLSK